MGRKTRAPEPVVPAVPAEGDLIARVKAAYTGRSDISGSPAPSFTCVLLNQLDRALYRGADPDPEVVTLQDHAALRALQGIAPRDPVEGMLGVQMIAAHEAALECFRRAHLPEQTFEGRQAALGQANKLVRSYAALVETLDRHRGKGQPQVVRVERVTVEAGGQAIVGAVSQGGGDGRGTDERSRAKALGHAPEPALRGADPEREPVPVAGGEGQAPV